MAKKRKGPSSLIKTNLSANAVNTDKAPVCKTASTELGQNRSPVIIDLCNSDSDTEQPVSASSRVPVKVKARGMGNRRPLSVIKDTSSGAVNLSILGKEKSKKAASDDLLNHAEDLGRIHGAAESECAVQEKNAVKEKPAAKETLKTSPVIDADIGAGSRLDALGIENSSPSMRNAQKLPGVSQRGQIYPPVALSGEESLVQDESLPSPEDTNAEEEFEPLYHYGGNAMPAPQWQGAVSSDDESDNDVEPSSFLTLGKANKMVQEPERPGRHPSTTDGQKNKVRIKTPVIPSFQKPPSSDTTSREAELRKRRRQRELAAAQEAAEAEALLKKEEDEAREAALEKENLGACNRSNPSMSGGASTPSFMVEESKPSAEHADSGGLQMEGGKIGLKLRTEDGEEHCYKLGKTDNLGKMFLAFAKKVGGLVDEFQFVFDGQKLSLKQSPLDLDMDDDDMIEVSSLR